MSAYYEKNEKELCLSDNQHKNDREKPQRLIYVSANNCARCKFSFQVLSLGEDVLPNFILDKKIDQQEKWIILHYSPFKVCLIQIFKSFRELKRAVTFSYK